MALVSNTTPNADLDQNNLTKEQQIAEEYKTWKKNCHLMYDMVSESTLTWPSLTFQWLPEIERGNEGYDTHFALIGTHTSSSDVDYVQVAQIDLPNESRAKDGKQTIDTRLKVIKSLAHDGEVNRARYMPQNSKLVATMNGEGAAYVYNIKSAPASSGVSTPLLKLQHHSDNGYGISWNPSNEGQLLTSSDDSTVALWDITSNHISQASGLSVKPTRVYTSHEDVVNDVEWHSKDPVIFGCVSDDKYLRIYDLRVDKETPILSQMAHNEAVNTLAFHPTSRHLVATGSSDKNLNLFDLRNLSHNLHTFVGHSDSVTSLSWSPHDDRILASGGQDRRVISWDISKIGEEQTQDDAEDGDPELHFMHGGHTAPVTDFSWNLNNKWTIGSCADDNIVQIWKMSNRIVGSQENPMDPAFLE
ncbi:WD40 repeat-like protein [Nadsonia fulvescens var. elongata DSM 6958]|uniref:WD40 repeat-like protein n=1 Tax=Nadsonia fulvescens var. elongata DSM 6958 TaxID=857566 RepID=A0A1E3PH01_9ASCO|nr:WD40 repeat-like protein [Nadsonia fulvescens var. elongata DSM 6958]